MINLKESQTVEFKQLWRDEYLKTICAFANSDGGVFYVGIMDNGAVPGLDDIESLLEKLPNKRNNRLGLLVDIVSEAVEIGVSSDAIKQHLAKLQKENRLKRVGGRKDGVWEIIDE